MFQNSWKAATQFATVSLTELTDIIFIFSVFIATFAVLFVIDLSFFSNYGIRIGGVVAVGLFKVFKSVITSFK